MAKKSLPAARSKATRPKLMLTESPAETVHRVACVLTFLSDADAPEERDDGNDDAEFGRFIVLRDLAASLHWAQEMNYGQEKRNV